MVPVELFAKPDEVRDNVGCNHDVVLHQRWHRWLLKFLDDFCRPNDGLAQTSVFHVKTFEFGFLFCKQVKRRLVNLCWSRCCVVSSILAVVR